MTLQAETSHFIPNFGETIEDDEKQTNVLFMIFVSLLLSNLYTFFVGSLLEDFKVFKQIILFIYRR